MLVFLRKLLFHLIHLLFCLVLHKYMFLDLSFLNYVEWCPFAYLSGEAELLCFCLIWHLPGVRLVILYALMCVPLCLEYGAFSIAVASVSFLCADLTIGTVLWASCLFDICRSVICVCVLRVIGCYSSAGAICLTCYLECIPTCICLIFEL